MKANPLMPGNTALIWLMLSLSLAAAPHFYYQPLWVASLFFAMIGWRCLSLWQHWPLPNKQHRLLQLLQLTIAVGAGLLMINSYGNFIGRDAGTALLIVMLGLKVIEIRSHRDYYLSCFLGYFLVVTNFLYSQSIPTALLMFIVVILITTALISLNDKQQQLSQKAQLKLASKMLLQAVPLMILLFILFPRISGPLWGLPQDASTARTGIDNKMTLGNISQLIQSDAVAFRVNFDGDRPQAQDLYWRGPVLSDTDGVTWTEHTFPTDSLDITPTIINQGKRYAYTITIEPHDRHWLFALDLPESLPTSLSSKQSYTGELLSQQAIKQRQQYQLSSTPQFQLNPNVEPLLVDALSLPLNLHPKTVQLAQQWRQQTADPQVLIQKALQYFNQQAFFYTLSPPALQGDVIDQFLFESRRGFCEHYAASFTILMRAAGVPTRIVTGYQGGEFNTVDDYLVVRQRDAHAWTEVWLAGQGWIRVDPTAAVSQSRIEQGINNLLPDNLRAPLLFSQSAGLIDIWQQLRQNWDALNHAWNRSILAYGPELQKSFLANLGMSNPNWQIMAVYLFAAFSIILLISAALFLYQRDARDPCVVLYQQFCDRLTKLGATPPLHYEGPLDYASRLCITFPQYQSQINEITQQYIAIRYAKKSFPLSQFKQTIKQFKPRK